MRGYHSPSMAISQAIVIPIDQSQICKTQSPQSQTQLMWRVGRTELTGRRGGERSCKPDQTSTARNHFQNTILSLDSLQTTIHRLGPSEQVNRKRANEQIVCALARVPARGLASHFRKRTEKRSRPVSEEGNGSPRTLGTSRRSAPAPSASSALWQTCCLRVPEFCHFRFPTCPWELKNAHQILHS